MQPGIEDLEFDSQGNAISKLDHNELHQELHEETLYVKEVPGFGPEWNEDLKRRKKELRIYSQRNVVWRWMEQGNDRKKYSSASGHELYAMHRTKSARKFYSLIQMDPESPQRRIRLIQYLLKHKKQFSLQEYKALLQQCMLSCLLDELSNEALYLGIQVQNRYLDALAEKCNEGLHKLDQNLNMMAKSLASKIQYQTVENQSQQVQFTLDAIKLIKKITPRRALSTTRQQITISEISALTQKRPERFRYARNELFRKAYQVLSLATCMPPLHQEASRYLDLLARVDVKHPVPSFLKARMQRSYLNMRTHQYRTGYRKPEVGSEIIKLANEIYQSYGIAMKKIGFSPSSSTEETIIFEYADFLYDYYRSATNHLYIHIPQDWINKVFSKAVKKLELLPPSTHVRLLSSNLKHIIKDRHTSPIAEMAY